MKKTKNIFLTTLGSTGDRLDINYYACETPSGYDTYTTGVSVTEAGIKTILSQYRIDEIIMIGSPANVSVNSVQQTVLSDVTIYGTSELDEMSEYDFISYRVSEYVMQMDIELLDLMEQVSEERQEELKKRINTFKREKANDIGYTQLFGRLSSDEAFEKEFADNLLYDANKSEREWVKYYIYKGMDSFYKMHMLEENYNTLLTFVPISIDDALTMADIRGVVEATLSDVQCDVNLYMDIQGLGAIDGNTLISTFLLMNRRIGYGCNVAGLINSYMAPDAFAGKVTNVLKSYEIQRLITGIDLFLKYGKVDMLRSYWDSLEISDADADRLFYGMDCIDEGICLCNVDLIACGIRVIRWAMNHPKSMPGDRNIYLDVIMKAIASDYGSLLKGDELSVAELLKWSLRKGLYQQALTIIESKVPEDIVKRGIYYYARTGEDIFKLKKEFNYLYWTETAKMRWAFNDIEHYFIKSYGRSCLDFRQKPDLVARDYAHLRIDALHGRTEDILPAYSELCNDDLLYELLLGYYRIGNLRNQVNHAIVEEPNSDVEELAPRKDGRTELHTELKKFIGLYSAACKKTKKKHEPMLLSSGRMKYYSRNHQLVPFDEKEDLTVKSTYTCSYNGKEVQINIALFKPEEDIDEEE